MIQLDLLTSHQIPYLVYQKPVTNKKFIEEI